MRFTPNYTVSYHGEFHAAGKPFDIDAADEEEMKQHGTVDLSGNSVAPAPRKPGRPRKTN